jgi:predicted AAA+ superfamily ATPase
MRLKPEGYRNRLQDKQLDIYLRVFGAVQIDGPKWCGKTWTALAHANSDIHLDDQETNVSVAADKRLALLGDAPHLIDEWQEIPAVRDAVRRAVDESGSRPGSFILTGSSMPPRDEYSHSGVGRIASIQMRSMSLYEQGLSDGSVSLAGLFNGDFTESRADTSLKDVSEWICKGGWPAALSLGVEDAMLISRQYIRTLYTENAPKKNKSPQTARRLLESLARNSTTAVSLSAIASDMAGGEESDAKAKPDRQTVESYLEFFRDMYTFDELPGWDSPLRSKKRLRTKPKRYLTDQSLAAAALGVTPQRLITDGQLFGVLFENLCLHDLMVYAAAGNETADARLSYYHDENGREIDVIIELPDGRWGAIEIKLGEDKIKEGVAALTWLEAMLSANPMARVPKPTFKMVLVGNTSFARRTSEGVFVVPISKLTA